MPTPMFTIRIRSGKNFLDRVASVADNLGLRPAEFIQYALEKELEQAEKDQLKEDVAIEEIQKNVINNAQSLHVTLEDDDDQENQAMCQLCLKVFYIPSSAVDGPTLCPDCHDLAKGGSYSEVG